MNSQMKRLFAFTATLGLLALFALWQQPAAAGPDGKALFLAQKCNLCHSVSTQEITATTSSEKMKGPDLVNLDKTDAAWLAKFLTKQEKKDGKAHPKEFKGSEEELKALVAWIQAQKK